MQKFEPIRVKLIVEKKPILFEIDTGACVSVISEKDYNAKLSHVKLQPTSLVLSSYTHERIVPVGKLIVSVNFKGNRKQLQLYVVSNGANPLLGRDWMQALQLIISIPNKVNNVQTAVCSEVVVSSSAGAPVVCSASRIDCTSAPADVANRVVTNVNKTELSLESDVALQQACPDNQLVKLLYNEFPKVFTDKLGCFKGDPVKLKLKPNATPKYHKPRPLPFTLKDKVESELARLEMEGIISPVNSSQWATPIVPVLKTNGQIRLCGDFKVSLNPS